MAVEQYLQLMRQFLAGSMSVREFEAAYLETFKGDQSTMSEAAFQILDALFGDVDMFVAEDDLRREDDLDEADLRAAVEAAQERLARLQA